MEYPVKPESTEVKVRSRSQSISDAKALASLLLRSEREKKALDPHAALRLAEIVLELYPSEGGRK